jgi:hypothetical protein
VEERAPADARSGHDVLDSGLLKAYAGVFLHGGLVQPLAGGGGAALPRFPVIHFTHRGSAG